MCNLKSSMKGAINMGLILMMNPVGSLRLSGQDKTDQCGIVLGSFGNDNYTRIGLKVANYIRNINISKGWCHEDMQLDHIPVAYFSDQDQIDCPKGVVCFGTSAMAHWNGGSETVNDHHHKLGSWKIRFYHAQMLVNSPFPLTLYLDVDALPCGGDGVAKMFKAIRDGADVGSIKKMGIQRNDYCWTSPSHDCKFSLTPVNKDEKDEWKHFTERNAGVIITDLRKTRDMYKAWAGYIQKSAAEANTGIVGDQLAYRQALFEHRRYLKEHLFSPTEVCREKKGTDCTTGCYVFHGSKGEALEILS